MYCPPASVATAIGPDKPPIAFTILRSWRTQGMHTVSVGFARSSDLDEIVEAARIYAKGNMADVLLKEVEG